MFDRLEVSISSNATADELWERWSELGAMLDDTDDAVAAAKKRWEQTTEPVLKDRRWTGYLDATREYRVLQSWRDVFFAAYIFATDGADCAVFTAHPSVG